MTSVYITTKNIFCPKILSLIKQLFFFTLLSFPSQINGQALDNINDLSQITVDGSISIRSTLYTKSNIDARKNPFVSYLTGNININAFGMSFPFSVSLTTEKREFTQPFNQFGLSPSYKSFTAHLGYRSLNFSKYTLSGSRIFGAGAEFNPGILRFAFIYGEFNKAVDYDTTEGALSTPSYKRTGFALKTGIGSSSNFIDLIILKAKDDPNSIKIKPVDPNFLPSENIVLGINGKTNIINELSIFADAAVSGYTRDITAPEITSSDADKLSFVKNFLTPRISTNLFTAFNTGFDLRIKSFRMNASVTRVDPDYRSMGSYFVGSDLFSVSVSPSVALLNNQVRVATRFIFTKDNIQNKKLFTTKRFTPSVNLSYQNPDNWGVDFIYSDNITSQSDGLKPLIDSLKLDYSNPTFTLSPRISFGSQNLNHTIMMSGTYQKLKNNNLTRGKFSEYTNTGITASYSINFIKEKLGITSTVNHFNIKNYYANNNNTGIALSVNKLFFDDMMNLTSSSSMSFFESGSTFNQSIGCDFSVNKNHNFNLLLNFMQTSFSNSNQLKYSETTIMVGYVYKF